MKLTQVLALQHDRAKRALLNLHPQFELVVVSLHIKSGNLLKVG